MKRFAIALTLACMAAPVSGDVSLLRDQLMSADPATVSQAAPQVAALSASERKMLVLGLSASLRRDSDSARIAAQALGHCGPAAAEALPDLIEALRYDDPAVALAVGETLVKIGPAAVKPLIKSLEDPNFVVRERSAAILGLFGADARKACPELVDLLQDPQTSVQGAAAAALTKIGEPAVPYIVDSLKSSDVHGRKMLIGFLASFGAPATAPLINTLRKDDSPYIRAAAATALAGIRPAAPSVLLALIEALKDREDVVRTAAVVTLGQLGPQAKAAIGPLILVSMRDSEALARQRGQTTLEAIGVGDKSSLPGLIEILKHKDADVRLAGLTALGQAQAAPADLLPALALTIKDPDKSVRLHSIVMSAAACKTHSGAIPVLRSAVVDIVREVRHAAIAGLGECTSAPDAAALALEDALKDVDPLVRGVCVNALARLGPPAIPILLRVMTDSYAAVGDQAEQAILEMGEPAIPALEKAKASQDLFFQKKAPEMIARIQGQATRHSKPK